MTRLVFWTGYSLATGNQSVENGFCQQIRIYLGNISRMRQIKIIDLDGMVRQRVGLVKEKIACRTAHAQAFQACEFGNDMADATGITERFPFLFVEATSVIRTGKDLTVVFAVFAGNVGTNPFRIGVIGRNRLILFTGGHQTLQRACSLMV